MLYVHHVAGYLAKQLHYQNCPHYIGFCHLAQARYDAATCLRSVCDSLCLSDDILDLSLFSTCAHCAQARYDAATCLWSVCDSLCLSDDILDLSLVMDDFKISKLDRFRFDFLKKI